MFVDGRLNYLGCALSPIACQIVSETLQCLPRFKVSDLCGFDSKLRALQKFHASIRIPRQHTSSSDLSIYAFSDASHRHEHAYGQSGNVQFISVFGWIMPLWWGSKKHSLVTYSSAGAEIVAASDCIDRSLELQDILRDVLPTTTTNTVIFVDSNSLYTTL
jgi:hypothetical protein